MSDTSSTAPARRATPPPIASAALPTPPASQEKLQTAQADAPSPSRPAPHPRLLPKPTPSTEIDLEARAARAATYVLDFGKHRGKSLDDVAREDVSYISFLKTCGAAHDRSDLGDAMALYDRRAVRALHAKYPKALSFKFTFGRYIHRRMTEVPAEHMESLIRAKHHMWSKRPGLREALLFWDEWACLGRQNWGRLGMISKEEREAGARGSMCRRDKKKEARQMVVW